MEKRNNEQLVGLMSLSEEIGILNHKVKELVHDLHNTQNVLGQLQELADNVCNKVSEFATDVGNYEPVIEEDEQNIAEASYIVHSRKRQRVTPTPDGIEGEEELILETLEAKEEPLPTMEKITEVTKMGKDFSYLEDQTEQSEPPEQPRIPKMKQEHKKIFRDAKKKTKVPSESRKKTKKSLWKDE